MKLRNKVKLNQRRNKALSSLEKQLKSNTKPDGVNYISLTKSDVKRIEKEIETLKSKITQL